MAKDAASTETALNRLAIHTEFPVGELAATTSVRRMPDISVELVTFKNIGDDGTVYIGGTSNLTTAAGTTNETTGFPLGPNDPSPVLAAENLQNFWYRCSNPTPALAYLGQRR